MTYFVKNITDFYIIYQGVSVVRAFFCKTFKYNDRPDKVVIDNSSSNISDINSINKYTLTQEIQIL